VEKLDAEGTMKSNLKKMEARPDSNKMKLPDNYTTLYDFFSIIGMSYAISTVFIGNLLKT